MRIDGLRDAGLPGGRLDDLPGPGAVDAEELVFGPELFVEGVTLEGVRQVVGAGHPPGLPALADNIQDGVAVLQADLGRRQT